MDGKEGQAGGAPEFPGEVLESQRRLWDITRIVQPEMQSLDRFSHEELQDPWVQLRLLLETTMGTSAIELKLGSLAVILIFLFGMSLTGIPLIIFGILLVFSVVGILAAAIMAVILVLAGLFQRLFLEGSREDRYRNVLEGKTRQVLRVMCREQNLSESGNRQEVISRLSENSHSIWGTFMYLALAGLGILAYFVLSVLQFAS